MTGLRPTAAGNERARDVPIRPQDHGTVLTGAISHVTRWVGSLPAIGLSLGLTAVWVVGGFFVKGHFANSTYQFLVTATTTVVTFLMVFIIQNTQNRDDRAVQAKLDAQSEILRLVADRLGIDDVQDLLTQLVGVEDAPQDVIKAKQQRVRRAAGDGDRDGSPPASSAADATSESRPDVRSR
jgi:low affinity Fe/Cu permease